MQNINPPTNAKMSFIFVFFFLVEIQTLTILLPLIGLYTHPVAAISVDSKISMGTG